MALSAGSCIRITLESGSTIFILLNDPFGEERSGLFVPIEHYDSYQADDTVCVAKGHEWIRTKMFADFGGAVVSALAPLEEKLAKADGAVAAHAKEPNCSADLLEKLRYGIFQSDNTHAKHKSYACKIWGEKYETAPPEVEDDESQWYVS